MENPRAEFVRETDPNQGVSSRPREFDMVAIRKIPIVAYHFPLPGIGHIASYRVQPTLANVPAGSGRRGGRKSASARNEQYKRRGLIK